MDYFKRLNNFEFLIFSRQTKRKIEESSRGINRKRKVAGISRQKLQELYKRFRERQELLRVI